MRLAEKQDRLQAKKTPGYRTPKAGNLVLIPDFQHAKNKGRKLERCWSTPRIQERISHWAVSAQVRQLHDPPDVTKRYPLDDLLLFVFCDAEYLAALFQKSGDRVGAVQYSHDSMREADIWSEVQRGFDLTDIG